MNNSYIFPPSTLRPLHISLVHKQQHQSVDTVQKLTTVPPEHSYDPFTPAAAQLSQPWLIQRQWTSIDPLFSPTSPYLACNFPGTAPPSYIPLRAGDILTAVYWFWLHPVGPMSVWLARCAGDCRDEDVTRARWFKIWHAGFLEGPNLELGMWYQKKFQRWDGGPALWRVRIPRGLKKGLYMVRHEILSIHVGGRPQFYPECAHLNVTEGGEVVVPGEWTRRFPGAYDDDGECLARREGSMDGADETKGWCETVSTDGLQTSQSSSISTGRNMKTGRYVGQASLGFFRFSTLTTNRTMRSLEARFGKGTYNRIILTLYSGANINTAWGRWSYGLNDATETLGPSSSQICTNSQTQTTIMTL
jgi:hypothetical protein